MSIRRRKGYTMKYIKHNTVGGPIDISSIACGTVDIGGKVGKKESFAILDHFVEQGGNLIDTAKVYASWYVGDRPLSEEMIGYWMNVRGNRNDIVISTKGAHQLISDMDTPRVSAQYILQDIDESLFALGTDYIDIYWLHRDDDTKPVSEIMPALNKAIKAGKLLSIGASNWTPARMDEANAFCANNGLQGFSGMQILWSAAQYVDMLNFDDDLVQITPDIYQWCTQRGMLMFAYASQARGVFRKAPAAGGLANLNETYRRYFTNERIDAQIAYAYELAVKYDTTPSAVLLAYITSQGLPSVALAGFSRLAQAKDSLHDPDVMLTAEERARLGWLESAL